MTRVQQARTVLAGLFMTMSLHTGGCLARSLQQSSAGSAAAPSPATSPAYGTTLQSALSADPTLSGPILYKTFEAAYWSLAAQSGVYSGIPNAYDSQALPIGTDGSTVLISADAQLRIVFLAFSASGPTTAAMTTEQVKLQPASFLGSLFSGGGPPGVSSAVLAGFSAAEDSILTTLDQLSAGTTPIRVVCTGHAGGGAWAQLCGPWAQINFPYANVRVITFGAPRIGDAKWAWSFEQLVDLAYVWVTASDTTPNLPAALLPTNLTRVINDNSTVAGSGTANSLEYIVTTLNNTIQAGNANIPVTLSTNFTYGFLPSEAASAFAPPAGSNTGAIGDISSFVGNIKDSFGAVVSTAGHEIGEAVGSIFGGGESPSPSPPLSLGGLGSGAPTPGGAPGLPSGTGGAQEILGTGHDPDLPIIAKIELPIVQDCAVYASGPDTIAPGSIDIGPVPDVGTDVAVNWNESDQTAIFAFRGSSSSADWVQDIKLWLTESPSSGYFQELYPDTEVHAGFLEQFRAVTDQAANDSLNMGAQLLRLSKGAVPTRIECTGHSLGGGLATICGVWAAMVWPQSDVRIVTFGSPKAGNSDFAAGVLATVGRTYRVVNMYDEVPALPPISSYVHVDFGLWLNNGTVFLDDRPSISLDDLSWDFHGCDDHYQTGIQTSDGTSVPTWVLQTS